MSFHEKISRASSSWVPEGDGKKHVGVFIPCPASVDTKFPRRDKDPSPAHITFIYIGPVPVGKAEDVARIVQEGLSSVRPPVRVTASRLDHFDNGEGETIAHVVPEFSQDLREARSEIISALEDEGIEVLDKGKLEWKPHITLGYLPEGEEWEDDVPSAEWSFAEMEIWGLPDLYSVPLGGMEKASASYDSAVINNQEVTLPLSVSEAFYSARRAEGEHPATGVAPVTEEVFDILQGESRNEGSATLIAYSTWSAADRARLLSKMPVEALHSLLVRRFERKWWAHEPETILQVLAEEFGFILDAGGINRVRALHAICDAPKGDCPFYLDPESFRFLTLCLSGRALRADTDAYPSPHEMAVAMHVVQPIRPGAFSDQVLSFIAACCYYRSLWALTDVLEIAQPQILRLCRSLDIPVDQERVDRVVALSLRERETDGAAIPEVVRDADDVQALRIIEFEDGVLAALEHGDRVETAVIESWDRGAEDARRS